MSFNLSQNEKKSVLDVVRETIQHWIKNRKKPPLPEMKGNLALKAGAFVTIHKHGRLRGCIGHIVGEAPLLETIQEMAIAASTGDPRFPPVNGSELGDIDIEVSVLSPIERIKDVSVIEVGKHGIIISNGWNRGLLLPQVATKYGWDRETFLAETCHKAGLPEAAWKDPSTTIEIFSAEVFGEKDR